MLVNADKFFIAELQKNGYDIDYSKLVEIYRVSRESPACKQRKRRRDEENAAIEKAITEAYKAKQAEKALKVEKGRKKKKEERAV